MTTQSNSALPGRDHRRGFPRLTVLSALRDVAIIVALVATVMAALVLGPFSSSSGSAAVETDDTDIPTPGFDDTSIAPSAGDVDTVSTSGGSLEFETIADRRSDQATTVAESSASAATSMGSPTSPLAAVVEELPSRLGIPEAVDAPRPVSMEFERIGAGGIIDEVGVLANGEMEIPGAERVGWYRHGVAPGSAGSAVLAAHIAFDGRDGVFRHLDDALVGDTFSISFDDGSVRDYEVVEMAQYGKTELPFDRVFAKDGQPVVTLITCGGDFQSDVQSYADNVVAYAVEL